MAIEHPDELADDLAIRAAGHCLAAEVLIAKDPTQAFNGTYSASIWMLLGHALEIGTKSILATKGTNQTDLKGYGHDLNQLLDALEKSEGPATEPTKHVFAHMSGMHREHYMRYSGPAEIALPQLDVAVTVVRKVVQAAMELSGRSPAGSQN